MTIAQRFNAGFKASKPPKPRQGRSETGIPNRSVAPLGLPALYHAKPSVETLGYSRMSLRDKSLLNFRKALWLAWIPTREGNWLKSSLLDVGFHPGEMEEGSRGRGLRTPRPTMARAHPGGMLEGLFKAGGQGSGAPFRDT